MNPSTPSLDVWLTTATKKLSPSAKERIRLEIKSHFEDAVKTHLADGLTDTQAEASALADLGDAKSAARRFRKIHLTENEAKRIEARWSFWQRLIGNPLRLSFFCGFSLLYFSAVFYSLQKHNVSFVIPAILTVFFLALPTISFRIARRNYCQSRLLFQYALEMLYTVNQIIVFGWGLDGSWAWRVLSVYFIVLYFGLFRMWLKIQRIADISQELPSSIPTAS